MNRRNLLFLGLGSVALSGVASVALNYGLSIENNQINSDLIAAHDRKIYLRDLANEKGILYGSAIRGKRVLSDPKFADVVIKECSIVVPEGALKWDTLRPRPDLFNFDHADFLIDFAQKKHLLMRGHTLVWHEALPAWFYNTVNHKNAEEVLLNHIQIVVGRYAGQLHSWDVVNEAILPSDGHPDGLRATPWLKLLGSNYIDFAFRAAAKADPKAMLVYNDHWLDYDTHEGRTRRAAVLKLLERLKAQGTPVHALGIQAHLHRDQPRLNPRQLKQFLRQVAELGLKILITELDVTDKKLPKDIKTRDRMVAEAYEDYLNVVLEEPAVIAVLTWGLSDRYTWISSDNPRPDGAPVRPLPLDENFNRKPAWYAIARAFDRAPHR